MSHLDQSIERERESRRENHTNILTQLTCKNSKCITSKRLPNNFGIVRFSNKKWRYFNRMMRETFWDECISFQESKGMLSRELLFWYVSFVESSERERKIVEHDYTYLCRYRLLTFQFIKNFSEQFFLCLVTARNVCGKYRERERKQNERFYLRLSLLVMSSIMNSIGSSGLLTAKFFIKFPNNSGILFSVM